MKERIELEVGMSLIELAERAADREDERSLILIARIGQELLTNDDVDTADDADPLTVVEYADMLRNALKKGESVEAIKSSEFRTSLN